MRAVLIHERGDFDVMHVEEIEIPRPSSGQVLIKVALAGVNYADALIRMGAYAFLPPLPHSLGFEVVGTIEEVGPDVANLQTGTRVVSLVMGGYAEYALANAHDVVVLPDEVSDAQAVMIPVQGQTAYLSLKAAYIRQGDMVLVHSAAGGVGSIAVQLAKLLGAKLVIGTTTSAEKVDFIRSLGADAVVRTDESDWAEQVLKLTGGQGVQVLLETIGGPVGRQSIDCLAPFGRMVVYGSLTGQPTMFATQELIGKCASIIGYNTNIQSHEDQMRASQEILQAIISGQLRVIHESTFPLDQVSEAHKALLTGKTQGKVLLSM
ncbi:quinone oxidoreductase family protein [Tengunoibacter tsumagoiensis]|uniref:Quinone oxidoreductase n=1 Tax=Tengunoibacter tsumagoiensis TaxID=2014871 RepID=A0A402A456_9CHLR|nr:zinc-binding dehydrogenase [Tengunoibacter tsumagoiensis]GCE13849.1 quinone oxidoreductase [Tengunoibacter tsumagoiensis]